MRIELSVNGDPYRREVEPDLTLLSLLRDVLNLTGTKWGCLTGDCGACTVIVDGEPVTSCLQLAQQLQGREVTTIEGLQRGGRLNDVQAAFVSNGAAQCGFCTPGMMMTSVALLAKHPDPSEEDIRHAIAGNLCRCTGYMNIIKSVQYAARKMHEAKGGEKA